MEEYRSGISWIVMKLFIFCGVAALVIWVDTRRNGAFNPEIITAALMFGVLAYLLISLIKNIGFLGAVVAAVAVGFGLDKLLNMGILTDESSFYVVLIIGVLFVVWDAWQVVQYFRTECCISIGSRSKRSSLTKRDILTATQQKDKCPHCSSKDIMLHIGTPESPTNFWECSTCGKQF